MREPLKHHHITWKHDGSDIIGIIGCEDESVAFCHQCDESCAHPEDEGPHLECLVAQDIMTVGTTFLYCGNSTQVKNGPIEIDWDGADWVWWYEGDGHADLSPSEPVAVEDVELPESPCWCGNPKHTVVHIEAAVDSDLSVVGETVGP